MNLSKEQLKHDRINLGRLVKRLEKVVSEDRWSEADQNDDEAWVTVQGMAQKIRHARQLLLNVNCYEELDSQTISPAYVATMHETLDRLDEVVSVLKQRLEPKSVAQISYLSLLPLPTQEEDSTPEHKDAEPSPEAELIPSEPVSSERPLVESGPDPASDLLPSSSVPHVPESARASSFKPPSASSLLSASLQTHEELSNELARMATQLKRNTQFFSESLDKDKTLVQSAAEVLEKNYDSMTKERVRLKDHRGKSFGTTWMVFGSLLAVSIAWIFMFFIIRLT
ncbi:hypothetical protein K439DRAFT_1363316 [Ramaria rubella]|nr:hypothetical protein K439DRAFT_1363316 [Ramaria rubella]